MHTDEQKDVIINESESYYLENDAYIAPLRACSLMKETKDGFLKAYELDDESKTFFLNWKLKDNKSVIRFEKIQKKQSWDNSDIAYQMTFDVAEINTKSSGYPHFVSVEGKTLEAITNYFTELMADLSFGVCISRCHYTFDKNSICTYVLESEREDNVSQKFTFAKTLTDAQLETVKKLNESLRLGIVMLIRSQTGHCFVMSLGSMENMASSIKITYSPDEEEFKWHYEFYAFGNVNPYLGIQTNTFGTLIHYLMKVGILTGIGSIM